MNNFKIIDISQPIQKRTACFPGDTPFDFSLKGSYEDNQCYNLTSFQMSPHVGTHADAPAHVLDEMDVNQLAGMMPLAPFIGPCRLIDVSSCKGEIKLKDVQEKLNPAKILPRLLFRTRPQSQFDVFENDNSYFSVELIHYLGSHGVQLMGIDGPSVDPVSSKNLDAHHALISQKMVWLENLLLNDVQEGTYFLSALPLKMMELEAAPVRAVLLDFGVVHNSPPSQ